MKNTLIRICLMLCVATNMAYAQQSLADSILNVLKTAPPDTNRVNLLIDYIWEVGFVPTDRAVVYMNEALALAQQLNYTKGIATAYNGIGIVAEEDHQWDNALFYYKQALVLRQQLNDKRSIAATYNNIGNVLESKGKGHEALDYHHKNLTILKELKDTTRLARAEVNIAGVYEALGIYITATEHAQEARYIFEALGDKESLAKVYNTLGHIWFENEKYNQALPYYWDALQLFKDNKDTLGIANTIANIANTFDEWGNISHKPDTVAMSDAYYNQALYFYICIDDSTGISAIYNNKATMLKHLNRYQEGLGYARKSLEIRQRMDDRAGIMQSLNTYGDIYFGLKKYATALDYTKKYYDLAIALGDQKFEQKAYKDFSKIYAEIGDYVKAYDFRCKYDELRYKRLDENRAKEFTRREQTYADKKIADNAKRVELEVAQKDADLARGRATRNGLIGGGVALLLLTALLYNRSRLRARSNEQLAAKNATIERARKRADELLMNILPEMAAAELKLNNAVKPVRYESVTVMFTDFKGFTKIAEEVSPEELIAELDMCFRVFDAIMERYGLEKIKTIGDAYMCAGGLPMVNNTHPINAVEAAVEMLHELKILMDQKAAEGKPVFEMRVGIHTGPVVAGVVGSHKFAYDIWGDTVNIAARMEQASEPGRINISSATYDLVKHQYQCEKRGLVAAKNKGSIEMYFVA